MQAAEIKKLNEMTSGDNQLENLRMSLFEKDSELAALKARLADENEEHPDTGGTSDKNYVFIEELKREVSQKDKIIAQLDGSFQFQPSRFTSEGLRDVSIKGLATFAVVELT